MSRIEVSMSETAELTTPLIKALNQTGGWAERMNSGIARKGRYTVHLHGKGTADILFFPRCVDQSAMPGRLGEPLKWKNVWTQPVWIETKQPKGTTAKDQIDAQAAFKEKVEDLGHRYLRVTSIAECFEALGL